MGGSENEFGRKREKRASVAVNPVCQSLVHGLSALALRRNSPRKLATSLVTQFTSSFLSICVMFRSVVNALDHVPVPLFSLVVKVNHKVRQVGHQCPSERSSRCELDTLLVLRPLLLGRVDRFL